MMNRYRIILAAAAVTAFGVLWGWLTCGTFFSWIYRLPPVSVWRAPADMTWIFWVLNVAGHVVLAIIFVAVLRWIAKGLPGAWLVKGIAYGFIVWLAGSLPGLFASGMFMAVNPLWVVYMAINELLALPIAGVIAASIVLIRPQGE